MSSPRERFVMHENPRKRIESFASVRGIGSIACTPYDTIVSVRDSIDVVSDHELAQIMGRLDLTTLVPEDAARRLILYEHADFASNAYRITGMDFKLPYVDQPHKLVTPSIDGSVNLYTHRTVQFPNASQWAHTYKYTVYEKAPLYWLVTKQVDLGDARFEIQGAIPPGQLPEAAEILRSKAARDQMVGALSRALLHHTDTMPRPRDVNDIVSETLGKLASYHLRVETVPVSQETLVPTAQHILTVLRQLQIEQQAIILGITAQSVQPDRLAILSDGVPRFGCYISAAQDWDENWRKNQISTG